MKPENVMVVADADVIGGQRIKVVDFGIAKLTAALISNAQSSGGGTGQQVFLGTVAYASPEQCQMSSRVDAKSDVYSLGIMLYEMLGGALPFSGSVTEVLGMHIRDTPRPLQEFRKDLPKPVQDLVSGMLSKSAEARPSMAEVRERLARIMTMSSTPRSIGLLRWGLALIGLVCTVVAVLLIWSR